MVCIILTKELPAVDYYCIDSLSVINELYNAH